MRDGTMRSTRRDWKSAITYGEPIDIMQGGPSANEFHIQADARRRQDAEDEELHRQWVLW